MPIEEVLAKTEIQMQFYNIIILYTSSGPKLYSYRGCPSNTGPTIEAGLRWTGL
jgi:hypothetical protein